MWKGLREKGLRIGENKERIEERAKQEGTRDEQTIKERNKEKEG